MVKLKMLVSSMTAAALLSSCGSASSRPGSNVPNVFDKPISAAERGQLDSVRAQIDERLAAGMNFRVSGTASSVTIVHDRPAAIVVGPGNYVVIALVKATGPQFALSVVDATRTRRVDAFGDFSGGEGDSGGG